MGRAGTGLGPPVPPTRGHLIAVKANAPPAAQRSGMRNLLPFADRLQAGRQLATALAAYRGRHPLVLAIPRGALPIGRAVADALAGELDVVQVRKLGAPWNPELAIGAIDEQGQRYLSPYAGQLDLDPDWIEQCSQRELQRMQERRSRWSPLHPPIPARGRIVIVVDDGLATGASMIAALTAVRAQQPARLICALPVAAADSLQRVRGLADEVVCLATPPDFEAVGQYYRDFDPVDEDQVIALLQRHAGDPDGARELALEQAGLRAVLALPAHPWGLVGIAHGSGSGLDSPRNRAVAAQWSAAGLAVLRMDLLSADESATGIEPDLDRRARRLLDMLALARQRAALQRLPMGLFGGSTGAAVALRAAGLASHAVAAVVCRGGRIDLLDAAQLQAVYAPTLLLVGSEDRELLTLNRRLQPLLGQAELQVVAGADHLFSSAGALDQVARAALDWFRRHLCPPNPARNDS